MSIKRRRTAGGLRQRRIAGEQLKGQGLQRVAHQDGRRLVIGFVAGRTAAAQIVVVHGGQIVVHQRIDMYQLDGAGDGLHLVLRESDRMRGREAEGRPYPLAAAQHAVTHGLVQT